MYKILKKYSILFLVLISLIILFLYTRYKYINLEDKVQISFNNIKIAKVYSISEINFKDIKNDDFNKEIKDIFLKIYIRPLIIKSKDIKTSNMYYFEFEDYQNNLLKIDIINNNILSINGNLYKYKVNSSDKDNINKLDQVYSKFEN